MISRVSSFGRYLLVPLLRRELGDCHFPSSPLLGILVDGSKTLHAAGVFKPEVKTPFLDKDRGNALFYVGAERAQELQRFRAADDLRLQDRGNRGDKGDRSGVRAHRRQEQFAASFHYRVKPCRRCRRLGF
ncbi:unnamed protein product [Durusdinium trenchii]|uniref:Uncharacterized protein n=2 Tax=Durusdinium trenchii TaxID=1381693 RepID=A0ABP0PIN3_9DINO